MYKGIPCNFAFIANEVCCWKANHTGYTAQNCKIYFLYVFFKYSPHKKVQNKGCGPSLDLYFLSCANLCTMSP